MHLISFPEYSHIRENNQMLFNKSYSGFPVDNTET